MITVSVLQDKKSSWDPLHRNMNVLNTTECVLKSGEDAKFC